MLNSNFNLRTFLTESKAPKEQVQEAMLSEATVMEYIRERMSSMNNEVRSCMKEYLSTVNSIDADHEDAHAQLMNALEDFYNKLKAHFEADAAPMGAPGEETMDAPEVAPEAAPALTLEEEDPAFGAEEDLEEAKVEFHQDGKKTFEKEFDTEEEADLYKAKAADMADAQGVELKEAEHQGSNYKWPMSQATKDRKEADIDAITAAAIEADKEQFEKETSEADVNEALNKPLNQLGPAIEKKLRGIGLDIKIIPGALNVPVEDKQAVSKNNKLAAISFGETNGTEMMELVVHAERLKELEKIRDYFNVPSGGYGPDKDMGWVIKNVRNVNPGDVIASKAEKRGPLAFISFYRAKAADNDSKGILGTQSIKTTNKMAAEEVVKEALDPDTVSLLLGLAKTAVSAGTVPAALAILYQFKDNPKIAKTVAAFEKHLDK